MNHILQLRIRARLIAQLSVALTACFCLRLLWWARGAFHTTGLHTNVDSFLAAGVFAATFLILTAMTILCGWVAYPLIYRRRGPLTCWLSVVVTGPAVLCAFSPLSLFEPALRFLGNFDTRLEIEYSLAAALSASAAWDFWAAFHVDRSWRAIPAFLWILVGEAMLLWLNWFQLYFE
jgi:hypothetical protein